MIFGKKDKNGNLAVNMSSFEGIPQFGKGMALRLVLDESNQQLSIEPRIGKIQPVLLKYPQLTAAEVISEHEIIEKSKSTIGRAAVGGLLLGPLGAVVGGISGVGNKQKVSERKFLVINYISSVSNGPKVISFEVVGATLHLSEFLRALKSKLPAPKPELATQYL